jgi:hypothetical protein
LAQLIHGLVVVGFVVAIWGGAIGVEIWQRRQMLQLAHEEGLEFLGRDLPTLPPDLIEPISRMLWVKNCVYGVLHGERVLCFKYKKGWGRSTRWLLACALERTHPDAPVPELSGFDVVKADRWVLLFRNDLFMGSLVSAKWVRNIWAALRTSDEHAGPAKGVVAGNVVIRPRHER